VSLTATSSCPRRFLLLVSLELSGVTLIEHDVKDVDALPRGEAWTALDERKIMLLAWHMMHELSNSVATVLSKQGLIKTHVPPQDCFGFMWEGETSSTYTTDRAPKPDRDRQRWGERGWYMEDKLGGHLCMVDIVRLGLSLTFAWYSLPHSSRCNLRKSL
jgi:hypothetical protein